MLNDQKERDISIDFNQSCAVEASAGAGKTENVTLRILNTLANCVQQPEEICSITFTKKATGELKSRVMKHIDNAKNSPCPEAPHEKQSWLLAKKVLQKSRELGWGLEDSADRLTIVTFDSLCKSLISHLPFHGGIGADCQLVEDPSHLYRQAVHNMFSEMDKSEAWSESMRRFWLYLDGRERSIENLFVGLLSKRDQWLDIINLIRSQDNIRNVLENNLHDPIEERLQECIARLPNATMDRLNKVRSTLSEYSNNLPPEMNKSNNNLEALAGWQSLATWLLTGKGEWRKKFTFKEGFPPAKELTSPLAKQAIADCKKELLSCMEEFGQDDALKDLKTILSLPQSFYSENDWVVLEDIFSALPVLAAQLLLVMRENNQCDFTEVALCALDALGTEDNPTDLALRMDTAFNHLFVDEFQDTSSTQIKLLSKLMMGWELDSQKKLSITGDAKQSLYRFRASDPALFLDILDNGINGFKLKKLTLTTNFRSTDKVINWVDKVFEEVFPKKVDLTLATGPHTKSFTVRKGDESSGVFINGIIEDNDADAKQAEAVNIISKIKELRIKEPDAKIAILARNRGHLKNILTELDSQKVPYLASNFDPLASSFDVKWLVSVYGAITNSYDRLSWFTLLHAPFIGLDYEELEIIAECMTLDNCNVIEAIKQKRLSLQPNERLERVVDVMSWAINQFGRVAPQKLVERVWIALGGASVSNDNLADERIGYCLKAIEHLNKEDDLSLKSLNNKLDGKYSDRLSTDPNPVEVMTIHNSKGLEFTYVFIVGTTRTTRAEDKPLFLWESMRTSKGNSLLIAPLTPGGKASESGNYEYLRNLEKERGYHETDRLMYVAITRAEKACYIYFTKPSDSTWEVPQKGTLLRNIWIKTDVSEEINWVSGSLKDNNLNKEIDLAAKWSRLNSDWKPETLNDNEIVTIQPLYYAQNSNPLDLSSGIDRIVGEVGHRLIECCINQRTDLTQIFTHWEKWARMEFNRYGVCCDRHSSALKRIEKTVQALSEGTVSHWLLNPTNNIVSELEYQVNKSGNFEAKRIDIALYQSSTEVWLIDTKFIGDFTLAMNCFDKYEPQLTEYEQYFIDKGFTQIHKAIYLAELDILLGSDGVIKIAPLKAA